MQQNTVPLVSVVIPTLNSGKTLEACLRAIAAQKLPRDRYEIVLADAGSTDDTRAIARACGVDKIVENPLKTGEAGKTAGISAASGGLIALIDSDNILPDPDWLTRMTAPFADPDIVASEPIAYTVRKEDPALTRYFALLGMNDPLCLFTKNYDRMCAVTGKWTGLEVPQQDKGDYLKLTLSETALPTIGANGFVFRRSLLEHVSWTPYFFDIDVMHQAVGAGFPHVAKVKTGIVHLYCERLADFTRKQRRRIKDFLYFAQEKQRTYPWDRQKKSGIVLFCLATVLVAPLLVQMSRGFLRKPDRAWLFHVPVCWITLWMYGAATLRKALGFKQAPVKRDAWQSKT
ncbi:MAG TPA: glycosyltransferase family 2 protein [Kiritimatiellia bacterium]|nr:glycosyltransferase family 2 protein [Kiritimatiellia bacterium]HPS07018.1 glycosyltransferase family 2 protein [Kiritimatiellia bacterium]